MKYKTDKKRKQDEELYALYKEIWDENPHISEISGTPLPFVFNKAMFFCFAHVLSRGSHPNMTLVKRNIRLMTLEEHILYDNGSTKDNPDYQWVLLLKEELKRESNLR